MFLSVSKLQFSVSFKSNDVLPCSQVSCKSKWHVCSFRFFMLGRIQLELSSWMRMWMTSHVTGSPEDTAIWVTFREPKVVSTTSIGVSFNAWLESHGLCVSFLNIIILRVSKFWYLGQNLEKVWWLLNFNVPYGCSARAVVEESTNPKCGIRTNLAILYSRSVSPKMQWF